MYKLRTPYYRSSKNTVRQIEKVLRAAHGRLLVLFHFLLLFLVFVFLVVVVVLFLPVFFVFAALVGFA